MIQNYDLVIGKTIGKIGVLHKAEHLLCLLYF